MSEILIIVASAEIQVPTLSKTFSDLLALASDNVLRLGNEVRPMCASLLASGYIDADISRRESSLLITA